MSDSIHIGDCICLYAEDTQGFVYSYLSSSFHNDIAVRERENRLNPENVDPASISFEICVVNRYKFNKKYRTALNNTLSQENLTQLQIAAQAESEDNYNEKKRLYGKKLLYGQMVQLKHYFTKKYVHCSTKTTATTKAGNK